jgi:adenylate cyclase
MYTLIYAEGGAVKRQPLPPGNTIAGRAFTCDLVINDSSISRTHARFSVDGDRCSVADVGSTNGIYLNGDRITESILKDGDRLILGRLPVQIEHSAADLVAVSDDHPVELTVFRPIDGSGLTTYVHASSDASRLLMLLAEIARTLVRTQPLTDILNHVVDIAFDTVPADQACLMLREASTGDLVGRVVRSRDASNVNAASISRSIVNRVMSERVAVMDASAERSRSLMCAPLWNENDVIGLIYVDTTRLDKFSEADLALFAALANYAAVAIEQARLTARVFEEQRHRERLQRYHSPAVVNQILQTGTEADAPFLAQDRDLTVIFADLVGFTRLSEGLAPQEVAQLLNTYFGKMTDVIFEHDGTLDKFIGDAILAVFGAPLEQPDHALRAVRCALAMRNALVALNEALPGTPLQVRIALHSGVAMVGDIGSPKRREYTVLGDVVNIASRLESTVAKPGQIITTRETWQRLNDAIPARSLGVVALPGRSGQIEVVEIEG